jgi:hypothetical protein
VDRTTVDTTLVEAVLFVETEAIWLFCSTVFE